MEEYQQRLRLNVRFIFRFYFMKFICKWLILERTRTSGCAVDELISTEFRIAIQRGGEIEKVRLCWLVEIRDRLEKQIETVRWPLTVTIIKRGADVVWIKCTEAAAKWIPVQAEIPVIRLNPYEKARAIQLASCIGKNLIKLIR